MQICTASSKIIWSGDIIFSPCCSYPEQHSVSDPGANQLIQVPEKKSNHITDAEGKERNERASERSKYILTYVLMVFGRMLLLLLATV